MRRKPSCRDLSRREFLRLSGQGVLYAALAGGGLGRAFAVPPPAACPAVNGGNPCRRRLIATDGFIELPGRDPLYIFGFREVDDPAEVDAPIVEITDKYKGNVQTSAPIMAVDQGTEFYLTVTNVGFVGRPDLDDAHTLHWHGFRNPIALFDGVPETSISVPPGRDFPYFYRPQDPGTYMYHCHFEDVEHVQMGMNGIVYVHPAQNYGTGSIPAARLGGSTSTGAPRGYVYNDGVAPGHPLSTAYDREFTLMLNEIDTRPHDNLINVQEFLWTDYKANFWIINGRAYPQTVLPNNHPSLPNQPISALVQVNAGERVLLRFANLGYEQHAMQAPGIRFRVVGHDATLLRGSGGADTSYQVTTLYLGPGEARDALFVAPAHSGGGGPDVYYLRNRNLHTLTNGGLPGLGGMATEVRVYPAGTLPQQTAPNETFSV